MLLRYLSGGSRVADRSERAMQLIAAFETRLLAGAFPQLQRAEIAQGLRERVRNPALINQGGSSLCGPSALLFNLARMTPDAYVEFAISLYENGYGRLGTLEVKPSSDLKAYNPPRGSIDPVDWMTAASIRDSENWFFDYQSVQDEIAGITVPSSLAKWYKAAGFTDVKDETNLFFYKTLENARTASALFDSGYVVSLFINSNMLSALNQRKSSLTPDHWVVLTSRMRLFDQSVSFEVFTWGSGIFKVPSAGTLTGKEFLSNYYGYVAAKAF